ncbi:hypothetical protein [Sinorhizobium meliloti]|uniref:hypothetical protein n=1 Tax=Rhizobium meliloti TaxID=382 RepID=UPI0001E4A62E|nr:hypothetical protein [Sinorhizobium meliloti]AEG53110.1 hypothetical protein Sinme_1363 [Sinorhizobium meliloti AK83]MDE4591176.1 hypothetical protein [Sinorhizobium meliloti]SEI55402.1 hypothetical protein SAMN04244575_01011 [Sinorhizobium meliloti]
MATVTTYAIHSIGRRVKDGKVLVPASTRERPSVFEATAEEFERLEKLGAVRKATKEEIAIAKVQSNEAADAPTTAEKIAASSTETKAPASGADGDPKGAPKGAAKAPGKDEEI